MANATTLESTKLSGQNVMIAFGLSAGLLIVAALIGSLIPNPGVMVVLAAAAFVGAGVLTLRIRPAARAIEPPIGAGLLALVLSIVQLALGARMMMPRVSLGQIIVSVLLFIVFASSLAWLGARLGMRGGFAGRHHDATSSP